MELVVICADCRAEYKANADLPTWECSACGRKAENKRYPFLTRRVAHAKSARSETNWEAMFDEVVAQGHDKVVALEAKVARLEAENRTLKGGKASPETERETVK